MAEDLSGLQTELSAMKREILDAMADLRQDLARVEATTSETGVKVQYLCDHLLGEADQIALRRAAGKR